MVNSALESHRAPYLKQFRICFYINKSAQSTVTKWLEFVWSRQVERLELRFLCRSQNRTVVLEDMLGGMRPMKYLRELCWINMKVSGEDISLFLRNCPLLRKLTVISSNLTSDVHVCGQTLMLEYLQLHHCVLSSESSLINISAPHLSEVKIGASPGQLWFKNVPKLVVATFLHHFAFQVSCITSQLHKLTLSVSYTEFLDKFKDETPEAERCPHQRLEILEFRGSSASNIIQSMTYICDEFQKYNTCAPVMSEAEVQAHRDHLKQLKAKLSNQFRLCFFKVKC
ncbi:uncharacterized protein LOC121755523 isoform X2 [Salvia splendens]|uniref:uncharacterized protein LOC121755523 isoform X2 n=1 Tax=Salvia splendens TaxID=180675 RepID=UPI001C25D529|nr:uncharacterized protein LOC121755523 isoform X2 [Salvia splendens]